MKTVLVLLTSLLACSAVAADRADEVRATEIAFAKAFADRNADNFFSYLAEDAQFLGRKRIMRGKKEVTAVCSEYFKPATAPFRWEPERVVTNATGDLGYSTGPVFHESGAQVGTYNSAWMRRPDGSLQIVFDGGSSCPPAK